jgi:hypothetical protein
MKIVDINNVDISVNLHKVDAGKIYDTKNAQTINEKI